MAVLVKVLFVVFIVLLIAVIAMYIIGRRMQSRQVENQKMIDAATQVVTMLVIDKKKMKLKEAPLPKQVYEQTPVWGKFMKIGVVKAKIGPRIMNFVCENQVFNHMPVKAECKVKASGIYITEILKGAVYTEKELEKRRKKKEKEAKKAAKA